MDSLSLSRFLFPLLLVFPLQVLSETVLDTSSPVLVTIFPVGVALRPVPPALPHLGAGEGGGASQSRWQRGGAVVGRQAEFQRGKMGKDKLRWKREGKWAGGFWWYIIN